MNRITRILIVTIAASTAVLSAAAQVPPAGQKNQLRGQVVDEAGKPIPNAAWKISGTESLRDSKWVRYIDSGWPADSFTDAEGRFAIPLDPSKRFDLQFHKTGFAPAFLYEMGAESPDLKVTLKRGELIRGVVSRRVEGKLVPSAGETVQLRLPGFDVWYDEHVITDTNGKFEFHACAPPFQPGMPSGNKLGPASPADPPRQFKWQVSCENKNFEIEVKDGRPVEPIDFEVVPGSAEPGKFPAPVPWKSPWKS